MLLSCGPADAVRLARRRRRSPPPRRHVNLRLRVATDAWGIDELARKRVRARLHQLLRTQSRAIDAIERSAELLSHHPAVPGAMPLAGRAIGRQQQALQARLSALGGPVEVTTAAAGLPASGTASNGLRVTARTLVDLAFGYEAAYQTARLAFDRETCDLLESLLPGVVAALTAAREALPHVVARELRDAGAPCACQCPMCSIGLCGCIRATLAVTTSAWTGHEPDRERGLSLMTPPRPGSQLAEAGLVEGDQIVAVDGVEVGSNGEVQDALRRREIGEEVRLDVRRGTRGRLEVVVRRLR